MTDLKKMAEEYVRMRSKAIEGIDREVCLLDYLAGARAALELAAKVCDSERQRQIGEDRFGKLKGEDTAFALAEAIRSLAVDKEGS